MNGTMIFLILKYVEKPLFAPLALWLWSYSLVRIPLSLSTLVGKMGDISYPCLTISHSAVQAVIHAKTGTSLACTGNSHVLDGCASAPRSFS